MLTTSPGYPDGGGRIDDSPSRPVVVVLEWRVHAGSELDAYRIASTRSSVAPTVRTELRPTGRPTSRPST